MQLCISLYGYVRNSLLYKQKRIVNSIRTRNQIWRSKEEQVTLPVHVRRPLKQSKQAGRPNPSGS